jgi:hypothetical protein
MDNLMKPYSRSNLNNEQLIFNYRLSRSGRIVENAFGIMASRSRILISKMELTPEKVSIIALTCCYLHKYLRGKNGSRCLQNGFDAEDLISGTLQYENWRSDQNQLINLQCNQSTNFSVAAKLTRDKFCHHFNNIGSVPWQIKFLNNS